MTERVVNDPADGHVKKQPLYILFKTALRTTKGVVVIRGSLFRFFLERPGGMVILGDSLFRHSLE